VADASGRSGGYRSDVISDQCLRDLAGATVWPASSASIRSTAARISSCQASGGLGPVDEPRPHPKAALADLLRADRSAHGGLQLGSDPAPKPLEMVAVEMDDVVHRVVEVGGIATFAPTVPGKRVITAREADCQGEDVGALEGEVGGVEGAQAAAAGASRGRNDRAPARPSPRPDRDRRPARPP